MTKSTERTPIPKRMEENIQNEILEVTLDELLPVNSNRFKMYRQFLRVHGHHFQRFLQYR
jgi:hypothetical protein